MWQRCSFSGLSFWKVAEKNTANNTVETCVLSKLSKGWNNLHECLQRRQIAAKLILYGTAAKYLCYEHEERRCWSWRSLFLLVYQGIVNSFKDHTTVICCCVMWKFSFSLSCKIFSHSSWRREKAALVKRRHILDIKLWLVGIKL